jgi:hypothetical protein
MAVTLLRAGDHLSLEMGSEDLDAVKAHIKSTYPDVTSEPAGIATRVQFAGADFTFQNEWDDPCLISGSVEGDRLLRSICDYFNAS